MGEGAGGRGRKGERRGKREWGEREKGITEKQPPRYIINQGTLSHWTSIFQEYM